MHYGMEPPKPEGMPRRTRVLTNVSLANRTLGTFSNGTLELADVDGDGTLSKGDFFTVTGVSGNRYELDVSVLYGSP